MRLAAMRPKMGQLAQHSIKSRGEMAKNSCIWKEDYHSISQCCKVAAVYKMVYSILVLIRVLPRGGRFLI
jgi:hypothetical protein